LRAFFVCAADRGCAKRKPESVPWRGAMAVVVQPTIVGTRSGVCFTVNPLDAHQAVLEAVHGMNQGLVDGAVEPDRWLVGREDGCVLNHHEPLRRHWFVVGPTGVHRVELPRDLSSRPPLADDEVGRIAALGRQAEQHFGRPQDVEWTMGDGSSSLTLLQSRPVTTPPPAPDPHGADRRTWYLTLRPGLSALAELHSRIVDEVLPGMDRAAAELADVEPADLADDALVAHRDAAAERLRFWTDAYWRDCIPFAHGVRLFGQVYNDRLRPSDPYAFTALLSQQPLAALGRNEALTSFAAAWRSRPDDEGSNDWCRRLAAVTEDIADGAAFLAVMSFDELQTQVTAWARELAFGSTTAPATTPRPPVAELEAAYFAAFGDEGADEARTLLDLARASWRLRDDDNLYLGRIEARLLAADAEIRRRAEGSVDALHRGTDEPVPRPAATRGGGFRAVPRQLRGQPAGAGCVTAPARVVLGPDDLFAFRKGEVLVCDVVEPNMTFIVPLAAAIVERRGGMLVHSAIVAREYGLPCVNGVAAVTEAVTTGDLVTVDGHLGVIVVHRTAGGRDSAT